MRTGVSNGHHGIRLVVRRRSEPKDVERVTSYDTQRFGESGESATTIADVSMWLYQPSAVDIDTEYGERLSGDLQGMALPTADIQQNDRVTHGGDTYEIGEILHLPDNDRKEVKLFSLNKVTNDAQ